MRLAPASGFCMIRANAAICFRTASRDSERASEGKAGVQLLAAPIASITEPSTSFRRTDIALCFADRHRAVSTVDLAGLVVDVIQDLCRSFPKSSIVLESFRVCLVIPHQAPAFRCLPHMQAGTWYNCRAFRLQDRDSCPQYAGNGSMSRPSNLPLRPVVLSRPQISQHGA